MSENEKTTREGPADVELEGDATTYRGRIVALEAEQAGQERNDE